ncbi:MAG: hypothetical protein KatS3mg099_447 [Candidatus Parcubacteria bacterium]|nr:MAG: hypothetical protein KatS3mg099_447 [Candidatus Parcubacteria bacterium]
MDGDVAAFTDANGTCTINPTNTALVCSSDARLKKDVATLSGSADNLSRIRAVTYRWLKESSTSTPPRFGVIAQEIQEVFPELVQTNPDNKLSVNYVGFIPILIDAVNEHSQPLPPCARRWLPQRSKTSQRLPKTPRTPRWPTGSSTLFAAPVAAVGKVMMNEVVVSQRLCVGEACLTGEDVRDLLEMRDAYKRGALGGSSGAADADASGSEEAPDTTAPTITILGNNPARIPVGTAYTDLGALVTDDTSPNIGYTIFVDGREVQAVTIDTSAPGEHTVRYEATDQAGNTATAERTVIVYDPSAVDDGGANAQDAGGAPAQTPPDDTLSVTDGTTGTPPQTSEGSAGSEGAAPQASSPEGASGAESSEDTSQGDEEDSTSSEENGSDSPLLSRNAPSDNLAPEDASAGEGSDAAQTPATGTPEQERDEA